MINYNDLKKCILFKGMDVNDIKSLTADSYLHRVAYENGETIVFEGDALNAVAIILDGKVEVQKVYPSGRMIVLKHLHKLNIFGEVSPFANEGNSPATVIAASDCTILYLDRACIMKLFKSDETFLNNFIHILSNRLLYLNNRVFLLSHSSIREKLSSFLLDEYSNQKSTTITLPMTKTVLSEMLNVTRPSLSRELTNMRNEGILDYHKNTITILNLDKLEQCLFQ